MTITTFLQHLAPLRLLTRGAGVVAQSRIPVIAQPLIRRFIRQHGIDLSEAVRCHPSDYESFNDFFTRGLLPSARPIADTEWVSPADGVISQRGEIAAGQLIQAKQQAYSINGLLGDTALAHYLEGGCFTTVYLSPRDYHRVHMPCAGRLLGMRYIPGTLFSVRPAIVNAMDGLLARNERLVCWFHHPQCGIFAMVLVGAAIVGSIHTVWHGAVNATNRRTIHEWRYAEQNHAVRFAKGEEMGHFQLGSTVIVLLPQTAVKWHPEWRVESAVKQGQAMIANPPPLPYTRQSLLELQQAYSTPTRP
ncbi:archaetidylserine decarboxylase [Paenalcaligenes sp. Me131]|uniref:archaetidylserine decarboxylase n=1 Tax=Paenalcaligenes sp. Me131 TaxID=3392636 RepID=UPI003D26DEAF